MKLQNQIAIVSGAASGMGAETARQLAKAGAKLVLLDLNNDRIHPLAKDLNGLALTCDVRDDQSVVSAVDEVVNKIGVPTICVNCAGIAPAKRMVGKESPMPLAEFKQVIDVNLIGTFNVMRVVAAAMAKASADKETDERGIIINTASIAAFEGQIGQVAYSASKGGVVAMTLPAARELAAFGIRVVTIAPGLVDTPMLQGLPENVRDSLASSIPFPKRFGKPSEYAELVLHIISNPLLNGNVIRLDGALRMQPK